MSALREHIYEIRSGLKQGDAQAIVDLHERVYKPEHGMDDRFVEGVRQTVVSGSSWRPSCGAVASGGG